MILKIEKPFGGLFAPTTSTNPEHYKFSLGVAATASLGKAQDGETGLYYFGARYYDPALGRWDDLTSFASRCPLSSRLVPQQAGRGEVRRLADRGEVIQPAGVHHADHH